MLRDTLVGLLLLTIFAIALPWPASAETRIALVIGNSAYPSGPLGSPKDDAKAVEAKLKALGFQVTRKTDLGREGFFNAIRDFGDGLQQPGTVGLFYYSGHGMQVNNRNYMIPTDADIRSDFDVARYAVPVEDVLVRMELGKSNPNIVILDACRNNPFEKRFKSSQDGLAQIDAPPSTLIAFAAAPGRVTEAGLGGKLSPYTEMLVEHIDQPYSNFVSMFQAVQNAVYERSGRKQSPRLELPPGLPDFSFKPVVAAISAPTPVPNPTPLSTQSAVGVYPHTYKAFEDFKECDVCPRMVALPGGILTMEAEEHISVGISMAPGTVLSGKGSISAERIETQHRVTIGAFAMGKTEVTFADWDACVAVGGCNRYKPPDNGWGRGSRPVGDVSWKDAKAYVSWLSQHTGKPYRLPSEAEWEYAARAGTTTRYAFGDAITPKDANYSESKLGKTTEVGSYPPNAWGFYDMHGNVWEWIEDIWHDSYKGAPTDGTAWTDGEGENFSRPRVVRGGSWHDVPSILRSAYRAGLVPDSHGSNVGFRVARTLD